MAKSEIIDAIAREAKITKTQASKTLGSILQSIEASLAEGGSTRLTGFGTFKTSKRKARQGKNPRTQEAITIPEKIVATFVAGKALKEAVNGKKSK